MDYFNNVFKTFLDIWDDMRGPGGKALWAVNKSKKAGVLVQQELKQLQGINTEIAVSPGVG